AFPDPSPKGAAPQRADSALPGSHRRPAWASPGALIRPFAGPLAGALDWFTGSGLRRRRPRARWRAQRFPGAAELQHAEVVVPPADDLQPDRQPVAREAGVDAERRLLAHVERQREG